MIREDWIYDRTMLLAKNGNEVLLRIFLKRRSFSIFFDSVPAKKYQAKESCTMIRLASTIHAVQFVYEYVYQRRPASVRHTIPLHTSFLACTFTCICTLHHLRREVVSDRSNDGMFQDTQCGCICVALFLKCIPCLFDLHFQRIYQ